MSSLEKAIAIAVEAHKGQLDKADEPYILHPLRLMFKMNTKNEMIAAVLHDVIEDCRDWSFERLKLEGFKKDIITALQLLTHDKKETYDSYIYKIKNNDIALKVKLADLEDNMDLKRITHPTEKDYKRISKYKMYYNHLANDDSKVGKKEEYFIFTYDNFHMDDDDGSDKSGPFGSQEEALTAAKEIVDQSLRWERSQSKDPTDPVELYDRYTSFGDDPSIRPETNPPFSAWDYAKSRCVDICKELVSAVE